MPQKRAFCIVLYEYDRIFPYYIIILDIESYDDLGDREKVRLHKLTVELKIQSLVKITLIF